MVRILVLAGAMVQGRDAVLEHAQRADDRAINPAEDQGQQDQEDDDADIGSHDGGQELDFGHPTQPEMQRPGEIQQEQRNADPEEYRKKEAEFFEHGSEPFEVQTNIMIFIFCTKCLSLSS